MRGALLILLVVHASSALPVAVLEHLDGAFGWRIKGGEANSMGRYEAIEMAVTAITEIGADGEPVASPYVLNSQNISISSANRSGVYEDGLLIDEMSLSATSTDAAETTVTLVAVNFLESGSISTFEPSAFLEVGNETVRVDVRIRDWVFCTPFGRNDGRRCMSEPQDVLLEKEGALPLPPTPPPPHTLLIPRCDGDIVATLRFVCDPGLLGCADIVSVKFYLGEADQDPGRAPNTATIGGGTSSGSADELEEFGVAGIYEHNLTRSEVQGFLNVSSLTPGRDYVFWSVWEHSNGSAPESNSQEFDLSRTQYWQCPGTTIERNFEVGTSLSVSLVVNGSTALTPLCDDASFALLSPPPPSSLSSSDARPASASTGAGTGSVCEQISASGGADDTAEHSRRLHVADSNGGRLLQEEDQSAATNETIDQATEGGESWAWDADGPVFGLGELSRLRLASHVVLLDGETGETWAPLLNTSSATAAVAAAAAAATEDGEDEEEVGRAGVITASLASFGSHEAVFSTVVLFNEVEAVEAASRGGAEVVKAATWVAVAFCIFVLWMLAWCGLRGAKNSHAAKTWPADVARARARAKSGLDHFDDSGFGSPSGSETDSTISGVKELQIFPMLGKPSASKLEGGEGAEKPLADGAPSSERSSLARPIGAPGWTTPGSASSKHNNKKNNAPGASGSLASGRTARNEGLPAEAFPLTDTAQAPPV